MGIFKLTIHALHILLLVSKSAEGTGTNCYVECACCKDGVCGQGQWFPDTCTNGCIDGYSGLRCIKPCPENCIRCYSVNNKEPCSDCHDGYYLGPESDCTSECLPNCKTCTSGSSCTSCKEGYHNENGSSDCRYINCPGNCKCENYECVSCMDGYYDISNSCNNTCPDNCVTCSSGNNCDSFKDGHYNGYQNDDRNLPLLNDCTYKCRHNCVQCSSYDICLKCQSGFYGPICEKTCSSGCSTGICNKQTGNCDCSPNYVGDKCDRCQSGNYGDMCEKQCSTGCKGNVCEKNFGDCKNGCIIDTIVGDKCDVCSPGWYGPYCNSSCSVGCKNEQCKRTDGECTEGCLNTFQGRQCDVCINGKYGNLCNSNCQNGCDVEGCLKESGDCIKCVRNFDGDKCDRCVIGFHGSTCSEKCPSNCLNKKCDRYSGACTYGCADNYSGDRCCVNNNNCIACLSNTKCKQCRNGYFTDQCAEMCHQNCNSSCNIETGICDDCKSTFYGDHCKFSCSPQCKVLNSVRGNRCHRQDGTCRHGCVDGFHGFWCSKNCSSYCIDNICNQGDGKCLKGCLTYVLDNPNCTSVQDLVSQEKSLQTAAVVLGTILAVSLIGYIVLGASLIFRRCWQRKSTRGPIYENSTVEFNNGTERKMDSPSTSQALGSNDMTMSRDYEELSGDQGIEHEYGQVRTPV